MSPLPAFLALVAQVAPPLAQRVEDPAGWWKDTLFYEVYVRSFADSDGDGHGDLRGLIQKLDLLQALGVGGLWLMPIYDGPSDHGYAVRSYEAIDPRYGTMADAEALIAEAHRRGLAVLFDFVPNHVSDQHPWFVAAKAHDLSARDHFVFSAEHPGSGWARPWGGGDGTAVWSEDSGLGGWYYHAFSASMPDLNLRDKATRASILHSFEAWLDRGLDGFRVDAVRYLFEDGPGAQADRPETLAFCQELANRARTHEGAILVEEAWAKDEIAARYLGPNVLAFDFDRALALDRALSEAKAEPLKEALDRAERLVPPGSAWASFGTNHDAPVKRAAAYGKDAQVVANALVLLGGGAPFLWQGDELGTRALDEDQTRRPFRWAPGEGAGFTTGKPWREIGGREPGDDLETQRADKGSIYARTMALSQLRAHSSALRLGLRFSVKTEKSDRVLAFMREDGPRRALVVLSFSSTAEGPSLDLRPLVGNLDASWPSCFGAERALAIKGGKAALLLPPAGVMVFDASSDHRAACGPAPVERLSLRWCASGAEPRSDLRCERGLRYRADRGLGFSRDVEAELQLQPGKRGKPQSVRLELGPRKGRQDALRYLVDLVPGPYQIDIEIDHLDPGASLLAEGAPLSIAKNRARGAVFVRDGRLGIEATGGAGILGLQILPAPTKRVAPAVEVLEDRVLVRGKEAGVVEWRMNDSATEPVESAPLLRDKGGFTATLGPWPRGAVHKIAWVVKSEQGPFLTAEGGHEFVVKIGQSP
ncbi:MAG: alpha-amylase family glycosyl hydrolase [Myxococcota bacterium]